MSFSIKVTAFLVLLLVNYRALACECVIVDFDSAVKKADAVFLGKVVSIDPATPSQAYAISSFQVEKSWKGVRGHKAHIKSGLSMCSYNFTVGKTYLVYSSEQAPTYTNGCSRTRLESDAQEDMVKLGKEIPLK